MRHNNGEAAFCQMVLPTMSPQCTTRSKKLPSGIGRRFPTSGDGGWAGRRAVPAPPVLLNRIAPQATQEKRTKAERS